MGAVPSPRVSLSPSNRYCGPDVPESEFNLHAAHDVATLALADLSRVYTDKMNARMARRTSRSQMTLVSPPVWLAPWEWLRSPTSARSVVMT